MNSVKSFMIGALVVAVGVLGYLYYQETSGKIGVKIEVPKIKVQ